MAQRDDRYLAVRQRGAEIRQIARHGIGGRDLAHLGQAERGCRDQRLGQRGESKHCVLAHRNRTLAIREAGRAAIDDRTVLHHQHDTADDAFLGERYINRAVDCGRVLYRCVHAGLPRTNYGGRARALTSPPIRAPRAVDCDLWRTRMPGPMLFEPISIRDVTLKNRVVVAPMHQYSAVKGFATDWHLMNVGRYAAGGAGLVFMESTKVERRGCGTIGDLGLWDDKFIPGLKRCVDFIRQHNAVPGIQLGHSGRKARRFRPWEGGAPLKPSPDIDDWEDWELVSSSAMNAPDTDPTPRMLTRAEIPQVVEHWGQAARPGAEAGVPVIDIPGAGGYLIHQFLSPFSNVRNDEYGGSELNGFRFAIALVE